MGPKRRAPPPEPPKLRSLPPDATPSVQPVLVEIFTSQGCSSCPRVDRMVAPLLRNKTLSKVFLPLAYHVDYWDGLGWKDPFSNKKWSARQRLYSARNRRNKVATPEIWLNGQRRVGAIRADLIRNAATRAARARRDGRIEVATQPAPMAVRVTVKGFLKRKVEGAMVDVRLALYEDGLTTLIERGENAGTELRNDRVVRELSVIDQIPTIGGSVTRKIVILPLPSNWKGRRYGVVAFMQVRPSMKVIASSGVHFGFTGDLPGARIKDKPKPPKSFLHQPL